MSLKRPPGWFLMPLFAPYFIAGAVDGAMTGDQLQYAGCMVFPVLVVLAAVTEYIPRMFNDERS